MDVPTRTTKAQIKAAVEPFYGRVKFVDIVQVYPDRTLAFVGFRYHEHAALALEGLNGSKLDFMVLRPQWAIPRKSKKKEGDSKKRRTARRKNVG